MHLYIIQKLHNSYYNITDKYDSLSAYYRREISASLIKISGGRKIESQS